MTPRRRGRDKLDRPPPAGKVDGKRFTWLDLPFFVVVAIVGGLQAALVTRMMLWWTRTRAKWAQPGGWRFRRRARVAEAVALSIVISVVFYAICLLGYCKKKPQDHDDDETDVVDCPPTWAPSASGGRRLSGAVRHHRLYPRPRRNLPSWRKPRVDRLRGISASRPRRRRDPPPRNTTSGTTATSAASTANTTTSRRCCSSAPKALSKISSRETRTRRRAARA